MRLCSIRSLAFSVGLILIGVSSCFGQLNDSEKANVLLKVDVNALRKDSLVKKYDVEGKIRQAMGPSVDFNVESIFVALRMTEDFKVVKEFVESLGQGGPPESVPFQYVQKIVFTDDESFEKMAEDMPKFFKRETVDGKVYLTPPKGEVVNGLIVLDQKNKALILGTKKFVKAVDGDLMESGLQKIWGNIPKDSPVRIAANLKSSRKFLSDFCDFSKELGPVVSLQVQALKTVDHLVIHANPSNAKMIHAEIACDDQKNVQKLQRQLNGYLGMLKMGLGPLENSPIFKDQKLKDFLADFKKQLEFQEDGRKLVFAYQKPEGFENLVETLVSLADEQRKKLETVNRFKMAALAVHMHQDTYRRLPFRYVSPGVAHKDLSWRMKICQFTDGKLAYDRSAPGKAWDDPKNKPFANRMPKDLGESKTHSDICWIESKVTRFRDITDGTSNTIMLMQKPGGVPWMQVKDLSADQAVKLVKGLKDGQQLVVAFYDGSVTRISNKIKEKDLRAMMTPAGGEVVNRYEAFKRR